MSQGIHNQVIFTKIYSAELAGVLVESDELVCKVVGTEIPMSVSTLSLFSSSGIVELRGILRCNGIEPEHLR